MEITLPSINSTHPQKETFVILKSIGEKSVQKLISSKGGLSGGGRPAKRVYDSPSKGILWGWEVAGYILTKALSAGILGLPLLLNEFGLINLTSQTIWITSWAVMKAR